MCLISCFPLCQVRLSKKIELSIYLLSFPMKPSADNHDVTEICRLAAQIPEPTNFFQGVGDLSGILPGKILCFARRHASELLGNPTQQAQQTDQHHRCVLLVAARGSGQLCLDADTFALDEGQAQFISPFQFHSYAAIEPEEICWIFITFEILSLAEIEPLRSCPSRPLGPTEWMLVRELLQCWLCEDRRSLLAHHLGLLLRRLGAIGSPRLSGPAGGSPNSEADLIARVNSYVLPRLDQPLRLKQLAQALGDSESHLRAKFRLRTGGSLGRHLRQLRLQKACRLLHTTALNITEIADRCGFDSVYSFSKTFKTGCGVSPRAYRRGAG